MSRDALDELLDRSAPASPHVPPAEFRAMAGDARKAARRSRRPRVWLTAGMVVALFAGGTGAAYAATGGFSWAPQEQDPRVVLSFTMNNGLQCEIQEAKLNVGPGAEPFFAQATKILHNWYRSGQAIADVQTLVPHYREELPYDTPGGTLADVDALPADEAEWVEYDHEETAWYMALGQAEWNELSSHGIPLSDVPLVETAGSGGQWHCYDNNGQPYPGAGA